MRGKKKSAAAKTRTPDWSVDNNTPYGISPFSSPFNQSELIKYKTRSDALRSEIGYFAFASVSKRVFVQNVSYENASNALPL